MPKFTYPIVFILNEEAGKYNALIPDLGITFVEDTLESVYACAEEVMHRFFTLALEHEIEYGTPSTLEEISDRWVGKGYKVSLITANISKK
ncbi:MAG: type II toxin-antitoxin system HicB family antitoxin [Firmicutes bacterium]|nr:type II toxin-antitoxin system HicB family antitoxin [Bacillota bacterium]